MQLAISQSRKEDQLKKETERQSIKMRSNTGILENKFHNLVHLSPNLTDGITDDKLKFNYIFANKISAVGFISQLLVRHGFDAATISSKLSPAERTATPAAGARAERASTTRTCAARTAASLGRTRRSCTTRRRRS